MIIYKVTNEINSKVYIGATTRTLNLRKNEHRYDAFTRKADYPLQVDIRTYGWKVFTFEEIDIASTTEELYKKEAYWIKYFNSIEFGYNTSAGYGNSGNKHSDKTIRLMKEARASREKHPNTKLTDAKVQQIKLILLSKTMTNENIGKMFNVGRSTISNIKIGYSWKHVKVEVA